MKDGEHTEPITAADGAEAREPQPLRQVAVDRFELGRELARDELPIVPILHYG